jgi:acyl-CoA synthetase (AMP-forming)/AMP-acid ligase II
MRWILTTKLRHLAGSGSPTERLPEVGPDDAAQIQYTSGTTGVPKGAVLRHRGITNNARFCAQILQAAPGDVWVNPMPLFHTAGCVLLTLGPVQHLFTQVLVPGFEPGLVLNLAESERAFDNPGATSEAIDAAGLLHTGDLGSADERGYYRIEGRLKEMIIRGGENIYPREIEQVLYTHPGIADVGVPDDH